jgi:S-adenosylmethionine:tRNA ribosyltransferase-isomerase
MTSIEQFDFALPPELIAQHPVSPRDHSRMLVCRSEGNLGAFSAPFEFEGRRFFELDKILTSNDFLIFNDAKVLPVRLLGRRLLENGTEGGQAELVLLKRQSLSEWTCLMKITAPARPGLKLVFAQGLVAEVLSSSEERSRDGGAVRVRFSTQELELWLNDNGHVPLPPYISRPDSEQDRNVYQTVYAANQGSAAAPTAGFHFTEELMQRLRDKGVGMGFLTLHVGLGTFKPMKAGAIEDHQMHTETFEVSEAFCENFLAAKRAGKRIVAVGTTSVRALESWHLQLGKDLRSGVFETAAYITPGYRFGLVQDLITNFHLPKSTLIIMISAAMGRENALNAYDLAIREKYRFFSYGDSMFIRGVLP